MKMKMVFTGLLFIAMLLVVGTITTYAQTSNDHPTETVTLETMNVDIQAPVAIKSEYQKFVDLYNQTCFGTTDAQVETTNTGYREQSARIILPLLGVYNNQYQDLCTYPVRYSSGPTVIYVYNYN